MTWLKQVANLDAKEVIKLLLLFGTIFAGCQINREEIKDVEAANDSSFVYVDADIAELQETIVKLNQRITALEAKKPTRRVVRRPAPKPKPGLFSWLPFIGG